MTTFDRWEGAVQPPEDYLMHYRTKGSKNGIRRYQTESGEWTPLGLAERRKREGFGESRKERKAQRQAQRSEKRQARKAAATARKAERAEAMRKRSLKGLTDAEMRQKLERARMEAEYRDLKRKGSLIETGAKLVSKYVEYKAQKDEREERRYNMQTQRINAQANLKRAGSEKARAKADKAKAKADKKQAKSDIIDNLTFGKGRKEAKKQLIDAKQRAKENTILGTIRKNIKRSLDANSEKKLYNTNEFYRQGVNDKRESERRRQENARIGSQAQVERAKAEQRKAEAELEKARLERKKKK